MTDDEMRQILSEQLNRYRTCEYGYLATRVDCDRLGHFEATHVDGTYYQTSFDVFWDDIPNGNVRVIGDLCAEPQKRQLVGGIWVYTPHVVAAFIMTPNGAFVGED
jgi:hypothetical protein